MSASSLTTNLTDEVLLFYSDAFYNLVEEQCGNVVVGIMKAQDISSVECLLELNNIFTFLELDSDDLIPLKEKAGIYLNDGRCMVKKGIIYKAETFLRSLRTLNQQHSINNPYHNFCSPLGVMISDDLLAKFPFIRIIITYSTLIMTSKIDFTFLNIILNNIFNNLINDERGYRYNNIVRQFAANIYILRGRTTYEFLRLNISTLLPSIQVIQSYIAASENHLTEGLFNYDRICDYFNLNQSTLGFYAEDCTAVVPKIQYDTSSNSFIGFSGPVDANGIPIADSFSTDSFTLFEHWCSTLLPVKSLNAFTVQAFPSSLNNALSYLLAAFGTDGTFTAADVLFRWRRIYQEFKSKGVRIIGFSHVIAIADIYLL